MCELLSPEQMGVCDVFTIAQGTPGIDLMERAGGAVADKAMAMAPPGGSILVLAGPGNNGGDGYVAARLLKDQGFTVQVAALGDPEALQGDARWAYEGWKGEVLPNDQVDRGHLARQDLIIDALFGAGLTRALDGEAARLVRDVIDSGRPLLAVDLPSGLDGATGRALGTVVQAATTVTFHRMKPGHVLYPGRKICGAISVADIGIHSAAIGESGYTAQLTGSYLTERLSNPSAAVHKYARGHALVVGGPPEKAGAGFLAASSALRVGAGLVTLAAPNATMSGSVGLYPALMRAVCDSARDLARLLSDDRLTACALGPGLAPDEATRQMVYAALASNLALVLDAGALTAFSGMADPLFARIKARNAPAVLTPHSGEFSRLFGTCSEPSKIERAKEAAARSGAILVLKGADTVVAHPSGQADGIYVNGNAPPWLATAGSGDVLTGVLAGLLAQSNARDQTPEEMAATVALGVWLHGAAGQRAGPNLVASDLEPALRAVLRDLGPADFAPLEG